MEWHPDCDIAIAVVQLKFTVDYQYSVDHVIYVIIKYSYMVYIAHFMHGYSYIQGKQSSSKMQTIMALIQYHFELISIVS